MKSNRRREDLLFMSEVDYALNDRGRRLSYITLIAIVLLLIATLVWAKIAVLDEVTRGFGRVIPSRRVQEIQNLEGGILSDIFVEEGQIIEKGTVLCRLHNEQAASFYRDAFSKSLENRAAIARLMAHIDGLEKPIFDDDLEQEAPLLISDQSRTFQAEKYQLEVEISLLENQYQQKKQEITELESQERQVAASLNVARKQRNIARPLVKKRIHSELDYLALEQKVLELSGNRSTLKLSIPRIRLAASEAQRRIEQRKAEFLATSWEEISARRQELNSIKETLSTGSDRVTRTDVRSPVKGVVKKIMINTLGGVVQPGESIMEVIPIDDSLVVEAEVKPADIAFLHPGQKAVVKITAYDFSIYGGLDGIVEHISADTIEDERGENFYLVKVRTQAKGMVYRGEKLPIIPGMTAQLDILTGKKSVLAYLLKPILKVKQNALRER